MMGIDCHGGLISGTEENCPAVEPEKTPTSPVEQDRNKKTEELLTVAEQSFYAWEVYM